MQKDSQPLQQRSTRTPFSSFNVKHIQNWDDFRKTFKPVKFDYSLNLATNEELQAFWQPLLNQLTTEPQKICILVPSRITKPELSENTSDSKQTKTEQQPKKTSKNAQKRGKDQKPANDVPLQQKVLECAMELIKSANKKVDQKLAQLDYDYSSLFLGNDKQLLIYRRCSSIEKYLEKYRLPKNFESPYEELAKIAKQFYEAKIQRNRAFSTFDNKLLEKTQKEAESLKQKLQDRLLQFKPLFKSILADFLSKPKCKELLLINAADELITHLREFCHEADAELINRFNDCDNDEFKDVVIIKKNDARLKPFDPRDYQEKVQYVYVDRVPEPEPPKDIRDLSFIKMDIQKQCYRYRIDLPTCGKYNPLQGVFIRSEPGNETYELNIDVKEGTKYVEAEIYPYRHGKSTYEIYTWNQHGLTKSTETIVLYNEMPLPGENSNKVKNRKIYFLGETEFGLYPQRADTGDELLPLIYQSKEYSTKGLALGNAAVICDAYGDVAGWGEMYCPQVESEEPKKKEEQFSMQQLLQANLRVETPCLLLSGKQIRKVSCGNGYCLMVSIFGAVFSMGYNQFGQLGLGHLNNGEENMNAAQICKFTNSTSPFIVDVQATVCGASFAITESGQAYRWGYNQVDETQFPIYDRFNSIINYSATPIFYKSANPTIITKHHISSNVTSIQAGSNFFVALDSQGTLYGWGECKYLGVAELKDRQEQVIFDIINPIQTMKNIQSVSAGFDHCLAITKEGKVIGWGNAAAFSNKSETFAKIPVDLTEQYGGREHIKMIKAARNYTAILTINNEIRIFGHSKGFKRDRYASELNIMDITCSYQDFIGVLAEPK